MHYTYRKDKPKIRILKVNPKCISVSLTLAVPVWLGEAVLVPTGQRCVRLVVVGSVLAVIAPQGAL